MVIRALFTKSIRDMQKSKAQFISIFIMAILAVSTVTGLDSIWKTIDDHADIMYAATNISDLWVNAANPTEKQLWSISRIKGVEKTEKRFTLNAITYLEGSPTLRIYTVSSQSTLDSPRLQEGRFTSRGGAILDEAFAKAHGLKINDEISLEINDKWIRFPIEGLALSSEHIYSVKGSTSIIPDPEKYGFIVINEDMLKNAYGQKVYNQVCVKLSQDADVTRVEAEIDKAIGDDLIGIVARDDNSSVSNINSNIRQFKTLATVFPLMFFLVTALITQSTMFRMVENQRGQIGVLKALGYSKRNILWHYTSYGVYVGLLGALLGLLIGPNIFGRVLVPWLNLVLPKVFPEPET
jgi:putative ABC transport system permease protein